jgi:hypothetical protein
MILRFSLRLAALLPALLPVLLLGACAGDDGGPADAKLEPGWPSLAPRVGEVSPLVPRVPLGVCATCGPDAAGTVTAPLPAMADLPAPEPGVLPGDIEARLERIEASISRIEAEWPAARDAAWAAIAGAPAGAVETEADVQASRYEALFQPLGSEDAALGVLEAAVANAEGAEAYAARMAALRARLVALEALRAGGINGGRD